MADVPTHVTMFVGTSADAYEECARVAECWRCAITFECSPEKRAQYERQNAMAETIAKVIRDKAAAPGPRLNDLWRAARDVCRFDWTDADPDADNAMTALQDVVASMLRHGRKGGPELPLAAGRAVGILEDCGQIDRARDTERERVARIVCAAAISRHGGPEDDEARQMTVDDRWHAYLPEADAILGKQPICYDSARYNRGECCGGTREEAAELFQSERISAAQATYDYVLGDLEPDDPDREERTFDAMKAAIQKADDIARTGQSGEAK